jgi:hypothetical protein
VVCTCVVTDECICNEAGRTKLECRVDNTCYCKSNVEGVSCDQCKPGFINLTQSNPDGCIAGCLPEQFRCENGVCISTNNVCDGADDCGDASDEASSTCPTRK